MAYTCVLAPSRECDGCEECESITRYDRWDDDSEYDRYKDKEYIREEERHDS